MALLDRGDGRAGDLWLLDEPHEDFNAPDYDPGHADAETRAVLSRTRAEGKGHVLDPYQKRYGAMFLNLATLDGSQRSIEGFAHRFGRLGLSEPLPYRVLRGAGAPVDCGEHIDTWRDCALAMGLAVSAWRLANVDSTTDERRAAKSFLKQHLQVAFKAGTTYRLVELPALTRRAWPLGDDDLRVELRGDTPRAMGSLVAQMASAYLAEGTSPALVSTDDGRFEMRINTTSLWQFMWLQLAQAASGKRKFLICRQCQRFYEVPSTAPTESRKYCSKSCKQMAWRRGLQS